MYCDFIHLYIIDVCACARTGNSSHIEPNIERIFKTERTLYSSNGNAANVIMYDVFGALLTVAAWNRVC